jgi:hypothetical protein
MMIELVPLVNFLTKAATSGACKVLEEAGLKESLTKSEVCRCYGRSNIDRWIREGLLKISKKCIDRLKLEAIAASSIRTTYLPVAER